MEINNQESNQMSFPQLSSQTSEVFSQQERKIDWYLGQIRKEERKRRLLIVVLALFILIISLSTVYGVYLVSQTTRVKSKAYETSSRKVELSNSYLFASPLKAKVGGERIRITVFILDGRGLGVAGKRVILSGGGHVEIEDMQDVTDDLGKAVFEVYSVTAGTYQLEAVIDGKVVPQKVLVTFE